MLIMSRDLQWKEQAPMNGLPFLQKPFTSTVLRVPSRRWLVEPSLATEEDEATLENGTPGFG
jgi:hypothetical protein